MEKRTKIFSKLLKKAKVWREKLSFVVIQEPDYSGGHRIEWFGYTSRYQDNAMEIADEYAEQPFTYILDYNAKEGDWFEEHYEPFHEEARDVPVMVTARSATFILN
jgi:hypothetical protein